MFIFDITSKLTFENIKYYWYDMCLSVLDPNKVVLYLIGTKLDLESECQVESSEAAIYANSFNM